MLLLGNIIDKARLKHEYGLWSRFKRADGDASFARSVVPKGKRKGTQNAEGQRRLSAPTSVTAASQSGTR